MDLPELPWDEAPTWARYAAMDKSGDWYWYAYDPPIHHKAIGWSTGPHKFQFFEGPKHNDWKNSKQARP